MSGFSRFFGPFSALFDLYFLYKTGVQIGIFPPCNSKKITHFWLEFLYIRKSGVFCRTLRPGVPKTTFFPDESTPTVLGGCCEGVSRGGGCISFFWLIYIYMWQHKIRYPPQWGTTGHQPEYVGASSSGKKVLFWTSSHAPRRKTPFPRGS